VPTHDFFTSPRTHWIGPSLTFSDSATLTSSSALRVRGLALQWNDVRHFLTSQIPCQWTARSHQVCLTPKAGTLYRGSTRLDPLDSLIYLALSTNLLSAGDSSCPDDPRRSFPTDSSPRQTGTSSTPITLETLPGSGRRANSVSFSHPRCPRRTIADFFLASTTTESRTLSTAPPRQVPAARIISTYQPSGRCLVPYGIPEVHPSRSSRSHHDVD
jgi:hypothetical protein